MVDFELDFSFDHQTEIPVLVNKASDRPLVDFQVFGERSSGTNFLTELVSRNTKLRPVQNYGWKHGWPVSVGYHPQSLILFIYREPIDWAVGMFNKPHAAHSSVELSNFSAFIRSEWAIFIRRNSNRVWGERWNATARPNLDLLEHAMDRHPLTGRRFRNIFEMRSLKLIAGLSFRNRNCNFIAAPYEAIRDNRKLFLRHLQDHFGVQLSDDVDIVKERVSPPNPTENRFERSQIIVDDFDFISSQLDHRLEKAVGYSLDPKTLSAVNKTTPDRFD